MLYALFNINFVSIQIVFVIKHTKFWKIDIKILSLHFIWKEKILRYNFI